MTEDEAKILLAEVKGERAEALMKLRREWVDQQAIIEKRYDRIGLDPSSPGLALSRNIELTQAHNSILRRMDEVEVRFYRRLTDVVNEYQDSINLKGNNNRSLFAER